MISENENIIRDAKNNFTQISLFSIGQIKKYFESFGITLALALDINAYLKITTLIQKANNRISKIPRDFLIIFWLKNKK